MTKTTIAAKRRGTLKPALTMVVSAAARRTWPWTAPMLLAALTVVAVEVAARTGVSDIGHLFFTENRPGPITAVVVFLMFLVADALIGRLFMSLFAIAPALVLLAAFSGQKRIYLADPLYPADLTYGTRQVFELLPALVHARPLTALAMGFGALALAFGLLLAWFRLRPLLLRLSLRDRALRLAIALPLLAGFASIMDYRVFSWTRDRLGITPIIWDQAENYRQNGFLLAFALNMPMAAGNAPTGYSQQAIDTIPSALPPGARGNGRSPDVIMVMSESLWDATRMKGVSLSPDPLAWLRRNQSGSVFSPEFGGMTANVEFEALTGFTNAFLPAGAIPYQQYIRKPIPSLASFFKSEGYRTMALHPFQNWFWNREIVYRNMGFDEFLSEEKMPAFPKRGIFPADADFTDEIMRQADNTEDPFFMFAVTLQGHGPYEPGRYKENTVAVDGPLSDASRATLETYTQGAREANDSLRRLMGWAKRRGRETIIIYFGDHLPPLGAPYVETGTLSSEVPSRNADPAELKIGRETPLMIWSSGTGVRKAGTVSPSFLPYYALKMAGFEHPYYSGVLGRLHEKYAVIDRHMLVKRNGTPLTDWNTGKDDEAPQIRTMRLLQYDVMFGEGYSLDRFFPSRVRNDGAPIG